LRKADEGLPEMFFFILPGTATYLHQARREWLLPLRLEYGRQGAECGLADYNNERLGVTPEHAASDGMRFACGMRMSPAQTPPTMASLHAMEHDA
jgi:hypothetical protein